MIRSVTRALSVLEAFDSEHQSLSLAELSRMTGIAKATVFRLVATLEGAGYLLRVEGNRLCLAPKLASVAAAVRSTMGIREVARPLMLELCRRTDETITLNELAGLERVCSDVADTPSPLMTVVKPGEHVSLLFGATGKILLAWMEPAAIDAAIVKLAPRERAGIDRAAGRRAEIEIRGRQQPLSVAVFASARDLPEPAGAAEPAAARA